MMEVVYEREKSQLQGEEGGTAAARGRPPVMMQYSLLHHCSLAALAEPTLIEDSVQFCMVQVRLHDMHGYACMGLRGRACIILGSTQGCT